MKQRIISGNHTFMKKTALPLIWKTGVKKVRVKEFLDTVMDIIFDSTDEQFNKFDESIKKIDGEYSLEKF
tara:strand:+ start:376 stop:585 length:210 start_codon:yes stop_codon:yes gene_type:complete